MSELALWKSDDFHRWKKRPPASVGLLVPHRMPWALFGPEVDPWSRRFMLPVVRVSLKHTVDAIEKKWYTQKNKLVPPKRIVIFQPSTFEGISIIYHLLAGSPRFVDSENAMNSSLEDGFLVQFASSIRGQKIDHKNPGDNWEASSDASAAAEYSS